MKLEDIAGYHYIDFKPNDQPKGFQKSLEKRDICERINKAIGDERQAVMEYKGLVMHGYDVLPETARDKILEMANDETDHHANFEAFKRELGC